MDKNEIIDRIKKNHSSIEVGNSQLEIIIQYVNEYFHKTDKPKKKGLINYLAQHNDSLELGNSSFEMLADIINE